MYMFTYNSMHFGGVWSPFNILIFFSFISRVSLMDKRLDGTLFTFLIIIAFVHVFYKIIYSMVYLTIIP